MSVSTLYFLKLFFFPLASVAIFRHGIVLMFLTTTSQSLPVVGLHTILGQYHWVSKFSQASGCSRLSKLYFQLYSLSWNLDPNYYCLLSLFTWTWYGHLKPLLDTSLGTGPGHLCPQLVHWPYFLTHKFSQLSYSCCGQLKNEWNFRQNVIWHEGLILTYLHHL